MIDEVRIFIYSSFLFSGHVEENEESIGNGGYGIVISVNDNKVKELAGGFSNTTLPRIEIMAIAKGLQEVNQPSSITVYIMNGYVIDALTKGWLTKWVNKGFKKKKHADIWLKLYKILSSFRSCSLSFKHSKEVRYVSHFQRAEQLAKEMSAKKNLPVDLIMQTSVKDLFSK